MLCDAAPKNVTWRRGCGGPDLYVVVDSTGMVLRVFDRDRAAVAFVAARAGKVRCAAVRINSQHSQYEQLARHAVGFQLEGYGPEPA